MIHVNVFVLFFFLMNFFFFVKQFVPFYPGGSGVFQLGLPTSVPPQYNTLKDCSPDILSMRLRVLYHFSDLMYKSWRLLNLDVKNPVIIYSPFFYELKLRVISV